MADYFGLPQVEKQKQIHEQQQAQERTPLRRPARRRSPTPAPASRRAPQTPGLPALPQILSREAALAASPRVRIETPNLSGSIALKGARIDDLSLTKYRETVDPHRPRSCCSRRRAGRTLLCRSRLGRGEPERACKAARPPIRCGGRKAQARSPSVVR